MVTMSTSSRNGAGRGAGRPRGRDIPPRNPILGIRGVTPPHLREAIREGRTPYDRSSLVPHSRINRSPREWSTVAAAWRSASFKRYVAANPAEDAVRKKVTVLRADTPASGTTKAALLP